MNGDNGRSFKQFDGTNYPNWRIRVMALLDYHEVKDIAISRVPENPNSRWKKKNKRCRYLIMQNIADSHLYHCVNREYAADIITELDDNYSQRDLQSLMIAERKMGALKIGENVMDIEKHIVKFKTILRELDDAGADLTEAKKISCFLLTLDQVKEYDTQVQIVEAKKDPDLKLSDVISQISTYGKSLKKPDESSTKVSTSAPVMQVNRGNPGVNNNNVNNNSKSSDPRKCFFCGRNGHVAKFCSRKLQNNNGNYNNRGNFNPNRGNFNPARGNFNNNRGGNNYNRGNYNNSNGFNRGGHNGGNYGNYRGNSQFGNSYDNNARFNNNSRSVCYRCNQEGHIAKFCNNNDSGNNRQANMTDNVTFFVEKHLYAV
ncbi:probable cyclin-dependent serine/threonine-protein kinase DDB_G0292550 [Planococcus citri]|uniref:probable cyclin-dependent serine/threonine-protein kinase DDB_G0292550 n=1 Tax=Planococcus citri TaxID=170843 RepID=UPI0031F937C6